MIPNRSVVNQQIEQMSGLLGQQRLNHTSKFYPNIATSFSNIQSPHHVINNQGHPIIYQNYSQVLRPQKMMQNSMKNSASHIIYRAGPINQLSHPVHMSDSHHNQINRSPPMIKVNFPAHNAQNISTIRPININRTTSDYRRNVSPINHNPQIHTSFFPAQNTLQQNNDLQKYESLRWQNKYQDLKTKYFELLSMAQKDKNVQDSWILQQENKLLKQKIRALEQRDHRYYSQVSGRIQKMVEFHKQTTTKQCELLMDRFRLENKLLQKI